MAGKIQPSSAGCQMREFHAKGVNFTRFDTLPWAIIGEFQPKIGLAPPLLK
jgi:hypothetical protein